MPRLGDHLRVTRKPCPEGVKEEASSDLSFLFRVEQRRMARALRGQHMERMIREGRIPFIGDENTINVLQGRVDSLVAPGK
jgi:hypothetical protein